MERLVATHLQPAGNFVQRPPLNFDIVLRLSVGAFSFLWAVALGCIGFIAYVQAHLDARKLLPACGLPSGRVHGDNLLFEIFIINLHPWKAMEMTLHGPARLSSATMDWTLES